MNLEVQNFYDLGQGENQNWVWTCQVNYPANAYKIIPEEISEIQLNSYLAQDYQLVSFELGKTILVKKPMEMCRWSYYPVSEELSTYTLLATPVIGAETQPDWSFLIKKSWTYGDITTNLLLILVLGVFVWDMLRRMLKTKF